MLTNTSLMTCGLNTFHVFPRVTRQVRADNY